jgi:hypothetical protein
MYVTQSKHMSLSFKFLKDTWLEGDLISIKNSGLADGGGGRGEWCGRPGQQSPRGGKM